MTNSVSRSGPPGPDQKELERARNTFETRLLSGLEVMGGFGGVADTLNLYNHYLKNPGYLGEDLAPPSRGDRRLGQAVRP